MATSLLIAEKMKVKQSNTWWLFNVDSEAFCYLLDRAFVEKAEVKVEGI